jgi:hypothetical protein
MTEDFFDFIKEPSKEQFLKSQRYVVEHKNYDPYTGELDDLMAFMDAKEFQKVIDFKSINTLLSPSAHLLKHHAAKEINDELNAKSEWFLFHKILENLLLTGDGSKEQPFFITQISDEQDIIQSMEDAVDRQSLIKDEGKSFDKINTKSGKTLYFDITACMAALAANFNTETVEEEEVEQEWDRQEQESGARVVEWDSGVKEGMSEEVSSTPEPSNDSEKKWWKFW